MTPKRWQRCSPRTIRAPNLSPRPWLRRGCAGARNWTSVFAGVPDFRSELVAASVDGNTEWGEWAWRGHHTDGSPFEMRGVTIFVIRDGLVAEGRLYMEPVEVSGGDIEEAGAEQKCTSRQGPRPTDQNAGSRTGRDPGRQAAGDCVRSDVTLPT